MVIDGFEFPEDLYYDEHHQYARVDGDLVTMGLSAYAQSAAKAIVYVELPRRGRKVEQGKPLGSIESGKWVGRLFAVVSGEVVEANAKLDDDPELINRDPYGAGWVVRLKAADLGQLGDLRRCTDPGFAPWFTAEVAKNRQSAGGK